MRIFVTGISGFVGRWLARELRAFGHQVTPHEPAKGRARVDVTRPTALTSALQQADPDAIVHLAAVSAPTAAARNPQHALRVTVGGTVNLMEAIRALDLRSPVLLVGSSEVYGKPRLGDLPLSEASALRPLTAYALSKIAQESVGLAHAARLDLPLVVVRPFNHIGPGQRADFVVPALARRVLAFKRGAARDIPVGNVDVRRDFTDVRDVVRAYRLLLERLADGSIARGGQVFNVASGRTVTIRTIAELLCATAGVPPKLRVEQSLVRADDPVEVSGDSSALHEVTGWRPAYPMRDTLHAVWDEAADGVEASLTPHSMVGAEQ